MEKKRNKKKLFAIIGGSVLAFVLTIALSVSITLAYFGGTDQKSATITLGAVVNLGTVTVTATPAEVIPTQAAKVEATAATPTSGTESVLFAVVKIGDESGNALAAETPAPTVDAAWQKVGKATAKDATGLTGDLYAIASDATTLTPLNAESYTLTYSFVVDPEIENWTGTAPSVVVTVQFIRVQQVYVADGAGQKLSTTLSDYTAVGGPLDLVGHITYSAA